jgi:hypothetical protein
MAFSFPIDRPTEWGATMISVVEAITATAVTNINTVLFMMVAPFSQDMLWLISSYP